MKELAEKWTRWPRGPVVRLIAGVVLLAGHVHAQPVRPTITMQPQSQTVAVGDDVTFVVSASGTLPMNYSWRLNGTIFTNILATENTSLFTLHDVQTNHAGGWRVGITNIAGPAFGGLSSNAVLTVFASGSPILSFRADDPGILTNGSGRVTFWPNGTGAGLDAVSANNTGYYGPIQATGVVNGVTRSVLRFDGNASLQSPLAQRPIGSLFVVMKTSDPTIANQRVVGWEDSNGGNHGLGLCPQLAGGLDAIFRNNGESGDILDSGKPNVAYELITVTWGPNGTSLHRNGVLVGTNASPTNLSADPAITALTIGGPGSGSAGRFLGDVLELRVYDSQLSPDTRISVEDGLMNTWLARIGPPIIVEAPVNQTNYLGDSVVFRVVADGSRPFSYQWQYFEVDIPGATNAVLTLENVQTNAVGCYRVVVSNGKGLIVSSSAWLSLTVLPPTEVGKLVAWGDNRHGQSTVPGVAQSGVLAIAAGGEHTVALKDNGSVVAWGGNEFGQSTVPATAQSGVTAVAAGDGYTIALKSDGTVVAWGQATVPFGLSGVTAIAAGFSRIFGLKNDGTVVAWERVWNGSSNVPVPVPAGLSGVTAIAQGFGHTVALKNDGSVVAWGLNDYGQTNVPVAAQSGVTAIAAGYSHTVALKDDGSVLAWGYDDIRTMVPVAAQSGVAAIAAGASHTVALKNDGSVVAWGANWYGQITVPSGLSRVKAIAAEWDHNVALIGDGTPTLTVQPVSRTVADGDNPELVVMAVGRGVLNFQWQRNGANIVGATNHILDFVNVQPEQAGDFRVMAANAVGAVTSRVARLEVLLRPRIQQLPPRLYITNGATVMINAQAAGTLPLQYQWRRNGENIPGATNATLTITNAQISDGGTYTVVVKNSVDVAISNPVVLVVLVPITPAGDYFTNRVVITGTNGRVAGTNVFATSEPGEPYHARKDGSNSVWYTWRPPVNGIARFDTVGSVFDTLLGVYTGTNVTNLVTIASDDDRGGYFTSELRFNAQTNVEYHIALDGFAGNAGEFVLSWEMEPTEETIPVITLQPVGQAVLPGTDVSFTTQASGPGLSYQWLFNGAALGGATSTNLVLSNVQPAHVGFYSVRVRNSFGREVESLPAALEIVSQPRPLSQDKLEDLFTGDIGNSGFRPASLGTFLVSLGNINYQIVNNTTSSTQQREPVHCRTIGVATRWLALQPSANGTFVVDTRGSVDTNGHAMATVLAVYIREATGFGIVQVACDDGTAVGSRVRFSAAANQEYLVMADGANYAKGNIQLNWQFGVPPPALSNAFRHLPVRPGSSVLLQAPTTNGIPPPSIQWFWNNLLLSGQTNVWLLLNQLQGTNSGAYSVTVSNGLGEVSHTTQVEVEEPVLLSVEPGLNQGLLRLHLPAVTNTAGASDPFGGIGSLGVMIETTSDLGSPTNWHAVYLHTNRVTGVTWEAPATNGLQFFRARRWP